MPDKRRLREDDELAEQQVNKELKIDQAIFRSRELIEFYKAGFIDGYSKAMGTTMAWEDLVKMCQRSFDKRFKISKNIKKVKKSKN